jgi:hypothetical protein
MALTVTDLAELVCRPGTDKAATVERLRSWTKEGVLPVAGDKNPGTGRAREYDISAAYTAVILNAVADVGLPIGRQRYLTVTLNVAAEAQAKWTQKRRPHLYLEIADFGDPNPQGGRHAVFLHDKATMHPRAEASLLLDVGRLFARVEKRMTELAKARAKAAA